jgi:hypothetical protein
VALIVAAANGVQPASAITTYGIDNTADGTKTPQTGIQSFTNTGTASNQQTMRVFKMGQSDAYIDFIRFTTATASNGNADQKIVASLFNLTAPASPGGAYLKNGPALGSSTLSYNQPS